MYTLRKQFRFEASHQLMDHDGKCARLHGHSWVGWAVLSYDALVARGPKRNMAQDYSDIKKPINDLVAHLDHSHLNDVLEETMPTSEVVAELCYGYLRPTLPNLVAVIIEETCTTECEYRP